MTACAWGKLNLVTILLNARYAGNDDQTTVHHDKKLGSIPQRTSVLLMNYPFLGYRRFWQTTLRKTSINSLLYKSTRLSRGKAMAVANPHEVTGLPIYRLWVSLRYYCQKPHLFHNPWRSSQKRQSQLSPLQNSRPCGSFRRFASGESLSGASK